MTLRRFGLGLALASAMAWMPPASAEEPVFGEEDALAAWLLPYTPVLFDLAVQVGRSFAEITYDARGFDPLTQSFSVSDLRIRRDALDLAIGRARVGAQQTLIEDIALDTKGFSLPPQLRNAADRLDGGMLRGDLLFRFRFDRARSAVDMTVTADFPQAGLIEVGAVLDGFHVLVPLEDIAEGEMSDDPVVKGTLHRATITFRDDGLIDLAAAVAAEEVGVTNDQIVEGVAVLPVLTATELLNGLPGGASEALRDEALGWARLVESALRERGAVRVTFEPPEPVPLALLGDGTLDEPLLRALNPRFSRELVGPMTGAPAAGPVDAALALIAGRGVPQNPERGLDELLRLARGGEAAAYPALAQAFGHTAGAITARPGREALLESLLVARALGHTVSDDVLAELATDMSAPQVSALERRAAELFGRLPQGRDAAARLAPDALAALQPRAMRKLAYDLFEGRGAVRDRTQAYVLADVAAALGDPFAATLRDDLAGAGGVPLIDLQAARRGAEELFGMVAGARAGAVAPPSPGAPPPSENGN